MERAVLSELCGFLRVFQLERLWVTNQADAIRSCLRKHLSLRPVPHFTCLPFNLPSSRTALKEVNYYPSLNCRFNMFQACLVLPQMS